MSLPPEPSLRGPSRGLEAPKVRPRSRTNSACSAGTLAPSRHSHRPGGREPHPRGLRQREGGSPRPRQKIEGPLDRSNAAWFVFPEEPDEAIRLTAENGLMRDTAVLAARTCWASSPGARSTAFGRGLLQLVKETPGPTLPIRLRRYPARTGAQALRRGQDRVGLHHARQRIARPRCQSGAPADQLRI